jgi:hypothetical protein
MTAAWALDRHLALAAVAILAAVPLPASSAPDAASLKPDAPAASIAANCESLAGDFLKVSDMQAAGLVVTGTLFTEEGAKSLLAVLVAGGSSRPAESLPGPRITLDAADVATVLMLRFGEDPDDVTLRFYRPGGCLIDSGKQTVGEWNAVLRAGGFAL